MKRARWILWYRDLSGDSGGPASEHQGRDVPRRARDAHGRSSARVLIGARWTRSAPPSTSTRRRPHREIPVVVRERSTYDQVAPLPRRVRRRHADPAGIDEFDAFGDEALCLGCSASTRLRGAPQSMIGTADYLLEFSDWLPQRRLRVLHGATCNLLLRARFSTSQAFPKTCGPVRTRSSTFPRRRGGSSGVSRRMRGFKHGAARGSATSSTTRASSARLCQGLPDGRVSVPEPGPAAILAVAAGLSPRAVREPVRANPAATKDAAARLAADRSRGVAWSVGLVRAR